MDMTNMHRWRIAIGLFIFLKGQYSSTCCSFYCFKSVYFYKGVLIKDLKVKGAPKDLKQGTRVKNIRIVEGDHNIDCKIDGFGAMKLKSEFVKKI